MGRATKTPRHHEVWESLGDKDPDWAVLTQPGRRHGGWAAELDAFYASGRVEVADVLASLPDREKTSHALDWGSGTGRLTFALLDTYDRVTAVDVSQSMLTTLVDRAQGFGLADRVSPMLVNDFRPEGEHDLSLSLLVLQHAADHAEVVRALESMIGSLRIGGHLVVEIPMRPLTLRARLQPRYRAYRVGRLLGLSPARMHRHGLSGISMLCLPAAVVTSTLESSGGEVLSVRTWRDDAHEYARYVVRRTN
jgi:SAM-dependent methyltransferase